QGDDPDENRHRSLRIRTRRSDMDFSTSMAVTAAGMRVQSERMKVISENIANADSTSPTPGADPYRRKVPTVTSKFDRELGAHLVANGKTVADKSEFRSKY